MTIPTMSAPTSVADLLRRSTEGRTDSPAIVGEGRNVTYGELSSRSNAIANGILAAGLAEGDRVAYLARNGTEYWELFFGTAKSGAVTVPLNFRLSASEIEWVLGDCAPAVIVVEEHLVELVPAEFAGLKLVFNQERDPIVPEGWRDFESWVGEQPTEDPHRDVVGDGLLSIMYSSGTTGRPKGVTTSSDAMLAAVKATSLELEPTADSVSVVPTPYYHVAAAGWSLIALAAGGRIVQFVEVTPQNMLSLTLGHRATHVIMVPTVIQMFINHPQAAAADFSHVEHLVYGGSPISETVMLGAQKLFNAKLTQLYGLTETIGVLAMLREGDHVIDDHGRLASAGRPASGSEVRVVDVVTGEDCEVGTVGEIVTRGPNVTRAYWKRPDATEESFFPGGWFRTGDAGYLDAGGYLFVKDRFKDMIISGGENIYPAEVENVLMAHPAVLEVAVIGVPSETWGETPRAVVVLKPGQSLEEAELIEFARANLAHYKCPTSVQVVDALPRNPSGKILKRELRAALEQATAV